MSFFPRLVLLHWLFPLVSLCVNNNDQQNGKTVQLKKPSRKTLGIIGGACSRQNDKSLLGKEAAPSREL